MLFVLEIKMSEKRSSTRVKRAPTRFEALSEDDAPLMSARKASSRNRKKMEEYNKIRRENRAGKKLEVEKENMGDGDVVEEEKTGDVSKK